MARGHAAPVGVMLACTLGAGLLAGCQTAASGGGQPVAAAAAAEASSVGATPTPSADGYRSPREYEAVAEPVRVRIPAARVNSTLQRLGRAADGTIEVPNSWNEAGWYTEGPRPGQPGPAVLLGHVDSTAGPAVFYYLRDMKPGVPVYVDRADGSTVSFRVTSVERVPKTEFPTDLVYGPTLEPSLRLVTCGGTFDRSKRSYRDNVIVYAEPG
jgi:Sortase domain